MSFISISYQVKASKIIFFNSCFVCQGNILISIKISQLSGTTLILTPHLIIVGVKTVCLSLNNSISVFGNFVSFSLKIISAAFSIALIPYCFVSRFLDHE
jgi:hypothetical protein